MKELKEKKNQEIRFDGRGTIRVERDVAYYYESAVHSETLMLLLSPRVVLFLYKI